MYMAQTWGTLHITLLSESKILNKSLKAKGLWDRTRDGNWPQEESARLFVYSLIHLFIYPIFNEQPNMWGTVPGDARIWSWIKYHLYPPVVDNLEKQFTISEFI